MRRRPQRSGADLDHDLGFDRDVEERLGGRDRTPRAPTGLPEGLDQQVRGSD
jgi:hypothetical protein